MQLNKEKSNFLTMKRIKKKLKKQPSINTSDIKEAKGYKYLGINVDCTGVFNDMLQ